VIPSDEVGIRLLFELVRNPPRHLGGGGLCYQNVAAWQGRYLAGTRAIVSNGGPMTPGTVVGYHDNPALRDFAAQLVDAFGVTGLFTSEYIVEKSTELPYLIEISRRISPGTHFCRDECRPLRGIPRSAARRCVAHAQPTGSG